MGYEVLDISGDAGIRAAGADMKELFRSAAEGMFGLITDTQKVKAKKEIRISLSAHSTEGLLVAWLNELIFHFDTYGFLGREFDIKGLGENKMDASAKGEEFDPERHERRLLIKAATYHNLKIEQKDGLYLAEIIFDI